MTCKKMVVWLMIVAMPLVVSGCLKSKTVVTVEKDGSGTVEQTLYYPEVDLAAGGFQFGVEGGGADGTEFGNSANKPTPEEELAATRAQAEQTAAQMGEGVTVQSVEALPANNGQKGVRIVYAFNDINQVHIDPMPEMTFGTGGMQLGNAGEEAFAAGEFGANEFGAGDFDSGGVGDTDSDVGDFPAAPQAAAGQAAGGEGQKIRFEFTSSPKPTLTIITPEVSPPPGSEPVDDDNPQAKAMAAMMMKQMFDGMVLEFRVRVNGQLTDTNATYASRNSNAVGLYRMDFDKLVENQAALEKLLSMDPNADEESVKKQLQDPLVAPYLKLETKERINVSFE